MEHFGGCPKVYLDESGASGTSETHLDNLRYEVCYVIWFMSRRCVKCSVRVRNMNVGLGCEIFRHLILTTLLFIWMHMYTKTSAHCGCVRSY